MKHFRAECMRFDGNVFEILDQTLLPFKEIWLPCMDCDTLVEIIQRLAIRGAPAVGIAASILLGLLAEKGAERKALLIDAEKLRAARPTAVNLMNNIASMTIAIETGSLPQSVVETAEALYREDVELCDKMAAHGAALIQSGDKLLTHCNTGGLVSPGIGTALGVITKAHQQEKKISVWVDETRPLLQGGRLTAWECVKRGIPHRIICDNTAGILMAKNEVSAVFVGADRIAINGDFANKIGTYSLAVLSRYHNIPFYIVAPTTTIDATCACGNNITIEIRGDDEIKGISASFGKHQWSPDDSGVYNPAFDITPATLVTAWVIDTGIFRYQDIQKEYWWKS